VEDLSSSIALLESKIEGAQGSTGKLSSESAKLVEDMATNMQARKTAQALRDKGEEAFNALEADLEAALEQVKSAIETLAEVNADQTDSDGAADFNKFMAKQPASALLQRKKANEALASIEVLVDPQHKTIVNSLLQAPFTGSYTSQSVQVMGIIKSMKDTFEERLASARKQEALDKKSHKDFMDVKKRAYKEMKALNEEKQSSMGTNDGDLSGLRKSLDNDKEQKDIKEEFLAELVPLCEERTKEYDVRKALRVNEDAAIAQAIAVLNSDAAFGTFQTVEATTASFFRVSFEICQVGELCK